MGRQSLSVIRLPHVIKILRNIKHNHKRACGSCRLTEFSSCNKCSLLLRIYACRVTAYWVWFRKDSLLLLLSLVMWVELFVCAMYVVETSLKSAFNAAAFLLLFALVSAHISSFLVCRFPMPPGKSWIFFLKIPGPGKSWKSTLVVESPGKISLKITHFYWF